MKKGREREQMEHDGKIMRILEILLGADELTTGQIAEAIAPTRKKNMYAFVSDELGELEQEGYIEGVKKRQAVGAPATFWKIRKNLSTVQKMFKKHPSFQRSLQSKEWVLDLIQRQRAPTTLAEDLRTDLLTMLRHSPSFFEFALLRNDITEVINRWFLTAHPAPLVGKEFHERYTSGDRVHHPFGYHTFFTFCAFLDHLNRRITPEEERVLAQVTAKRIKDQEVTRDIDRWSSGYLCATTILQMDQVAQSKDTVRFRSLVREATRYQALYDNWVKAGNDPDRAAPLERELNVLFQRLMDAVPAPAIWRGLGTERG